METVLRAGLPTSQALLLEELRRRSRKGKPHHTLPVWACQPLHAGLWAEELLALMAAAFCSRDGQEVAVVYYREGYVPSNYNQQVSTHCLLLEAVAGVCNTPWSCPGWG